MEESSRGVMVPMADWVLGSVEEEEDLGRSSEGSREGMGGDWFS